MKPDTIELFTCLACAEAKRNIDDFVKLDAATLNSCEVRYHASTCRDIITIFEALENFLLTAADEANKIDIAAMEAKANYCNPQFVTRKEHAIIHGMEGAEEE